MPSKFLRTSDLAKTVGCHPNTVRMYVEWGYLPPVDRNPKNYRLFTEKHRTHMQLAWLVFQGQFPGRVIRRSGRELVLHAATGDLGGGLEMAYSHLALVQSERVQAEAAADLLERWSQGLATDATVGPLRIGAAARLLKVTTDMLRNWENNGLIEIPRASNGYRKYRAPEIGRLRVIRMLVRAGYSLMSILRMLLALDAGEIADLRQILNTIPADEDIFIAADQWLSTLAHEENRANKIIVFLEKMIATEW
jgi:DNA-binding transcriptional MerR regulator